MPLSWARWVTQDCARFSCATSSSPGTLSPMLPGENEKGSWSATVPGGSDWPSSRNSIAACTPAATGICGARAWNRSIDAWSNETTTTSRRGLGRRNAARASATANFSVWSAPLISTFSGTCGKASTTSCSVGTRKSSASKPAGAGRAPVRTPRRG
ncbi:unannotated protein [freshwater metagenome]|uniref:Unannotated protein n=1 Tax=freshwater metagenome TaxID=449393 RepID=A0A6J7KYC6_9ZZZZ